MPAEISRHERGGELRGLFDNLSEVLQRRLFKFFLISNIAVGGEEVGYGM